MFDMYRCLQALPDNVILGKEKASILRTPIDSFVGQSSIGLLCPSAAELQALLRTMAKERNGQGRCQKLEMDTLEFAFSLIDVTSTRTHPLHEG